MLITQTPLRISLAGGGTDFKEFYTREDGVVLSMAIDKYVYVIIKERFDDMIYINYSTKEIVSHVDAIKHDLIRETMRKTGVYKGVEITLLADIPSEGSGLGSSSSVLVGILNALYVFKGEQRTAEDLAREACEIEIEILKRPIGKQDQYIAAYGDFRIFTFKGDGSVLIESIDISDEMKRRLCSTLFLYFTNHTRKSDDILTFQKKNINEKFQNLRNIKNLIPELAEAIKTGDFDRIGNILHRNWEEKKGLVDKITNGHIDNLYERALNAGATGGKLAGAGGGGFLLLYCPSQKQENLRNEFRDLRELPFLYERDGSKVIFNVRRHSTRWYY